jgi:serine/threonine protein kinase
MSIDWIFGEYKILKKIATGGMAEVFLAKRIGMKGFEKLLAIKRILPQFSENEEFIAMFIDEAKLAASRGPIISPWSIFLEKISGRF